MSLAVVVAAALLGQPGVITDLRPVARDDGWRPVLAPGEYLVPGSVRLVSATGQVTPMPDPPAPSKAAPQAAAPQQRVIVSTPQAYAPPAPMPSSSCYASSYGASAYGGPVYQPAPPQPLYGAYTAPAAAYERVPYAVPGPYPYAMARPVPTYAPPAWRVVPEYAAPARERRGLLGRFAMRGDIGMEHRVHNSFNVGFGIGDGARRMAAGGYGYGCGPFGCR